MVTEKGKARCPIFFFVKGEEGREKKEKRKRVDAILRTGGKKKKTRPKEEREIFNF